MPSKRQSWLRSPLLRRLRLPNTQTALLHVPLCTLTQGSGAWLECHLWSRHMLREASVLMQTGPWGAAPRPLTVGGARNGARGWLVELIPGEAHFPS